MSRGVTARARVAEPVELTLAARTREYWFHKHFSRSGAANPNVAHVNRRPDVLCGKATLICLNQRCRRDDINRTKPLNLWLRPGCVFSVFLRSFAHSCEP